MKASIHFGGCSCGCTPSQDKTITSNTREGLIYGIADNILNYRVYGSNPYRKCYWKILEGEQIDEKEIYAMADKLYAMEEQIHAKERELEGAFQAPYIATYEGTYPLTEEQKNINKAEHDKYLLKKEEIKKEIDEIRRQKASFYVDFDVELEDEEW